MRPLCSTRMRPSQHANMTPKPVFSPESLLALLAQGMSSDWLPLSRRIRRLHARGTRDAEIDRVARVVTASRERALARDAARPRVVYPPDLPIAERREEIAAAIRDNPLVIVCGETGSGKTTQLPKICLEIGRGVRGLIGHTQPRRIAARSVAARIAQELGGRVGNAVGYKVRFTDRTGPDAYIKLMTDGILLAETQGDPACSPRTTRSSSTRRTSAASTSTSCSATSSSSCARASRPQGHHHLGHARRRALRARISASGPCRAGDRGVGAAPTRSRCATARWRRSRRRGTTTRRNSRRRSSRRAEDLWREGPGDILVFLPGEREIRETAELLQRSLARRPYAAAVEVLPLYARLSVEQQQRVFAPSARTPHRARDQRRRDLAHRAGHPLA